MYSNKLVLAVKASGKILREFKDQVYIPFGTEYSLLIKNLNSVRASIQVSIDGTDATENVSLIIPAGGEIELERFIKQGNKDSGNKFKFIERTNAVEKTRGIQLEDGLIKVECHFEKQWAYNKPLYPLINTNLYAPGTPINNPPNWYSDTAQPPQVAPTWISNIVTRGSAQGGSTIPQGPIPRSTSCSVTRGGITDATSTQVYNDAGITVPGSVSDQAFTIVSPFPLELEGHVLVLNLVGETPQGKLIESPITTNVKQKCVTCGKVNKLTSKFCVECGTSLTIV